MGLITGYTDTTAVTSDDRMLGLDGGATKLIRPNDVGKYVAGRLGVFNVLDYGAVGDGVTDDTAAIQAAIDAAEAAGGGTVLVPAGSFLLTSSLSVTSGQGGISIIGSNAGTSVITTSSAITMLSVDGTSAPFLGHFNIRDLTFDGNDAATRGIHVTSGNFGEWFNVRIREAGIGLTFTTSEDFTLHGIDVRKCLTGGVLLDGTDSNSIRFVGGTIERNDGYGARLVSTRAVRFIGTKFHGRTTADDATPSAVTLLECQGAIRTQALGCFFAQARKFAIHATTDGGAVKSHVSVIGCTFSEAANYVGGDAILVELDGCHAIVDDCLFTNNTHSSYTGSGGDIRVASADSLIGVNIHQSAGSFQVSNTGGATYRHRSLSGFDLYAASGGQLLRAYRHGDANPRVEIMDDRIRMGGGTSSVDVVLSRPGADRLALGAGDSFEVDGTWNGGQIRMGAYRLWVDSTGDLRIKSGAPTSDTDGTVVGTQT